MESVRNLYENCRESSSLKKSLSGLFCFQKLVWSSHWTIGGNVIIIKHINIMEIFKKFRLLELFHLESIWFVCFSWLTLNLILPNYMCLNLFRGIRQKNQIYKRFSRLYFRFWNLNNVQSNPIFPSSIVRNNNSGWTTKHNRFRSAFFVVCWC